MSTRETFYIIDGNAFVYRAFFATPPMSTAMGIPSNAVFGFTRIMLSLLETEKPKNIVVVFDTGKACFRNRIYPEYKATRNATPEDLLAQFPYIRRVVEGLNIPILQKADYEADDVIATLVSRYKKDFKLVVVSADKDLMQLIEPGVSMLTQSKGVKVRYNDKKVEEKLGVPPKKVIDYLALCGDSSDNVPGVPGIGAKTAAKLLSQFESLEDIYNNLSDLKPRLAEKLTKNREKALLSQKLVTLCCDLSLKFDPATAGCGDYDNKKLTDLFKELEFRGLLNRFSRPEPPRPAPVKPSQPTEPSQTEFSFETEPIPVGPETVFLDSPDKWQKAAEAIQKADSCALSFLEEGEGPDAGLSYLVLLPDPSEKAYIIAPDSPPELEDELWEALQNAPSSLVTTDIKTIYLHLIKRGDKIPEKVVDIGLMAYLLEAGARDFGLTRLGIKYLGKMDDRDTKAIEALKKKRATREETADFLARKAQMILELSLVLLPLLKTAKLDALYRDMELPLAIVLARLQDRGIRVDRKLLSQYAEELSGQLETLEEDIKKQIGGEVNINSPKQLAKVLFEDLGLPVLKKTKTGPSTSEEVLLRLAEQHELPGHILSYRKLTKLLGTYVNPLTDFIDPDNGRIHARFNQRVTATGRLSSSNPNLQNVPIKSQAGRRIRRIFVAGDSSYTLVSADYSRIELRVLAHISKDETLCQAFANGEDVHTLTASEIFDLSPEEITEDMRRTAKVVNFGIVYGMGSFGLAKDLGITQKTAKTFIERYFARYHGVREFIDRTIIEAEEKGSVSTLLNRRRNIPELRSKNKNLRQFGERTAVNTIIQGTAADIIKLAMLAVDQNPALQDPSCRLLLSIHDELVFEVQKENLVEITAQIRSDMENAFPLSVPLPVNIGNGENLLDAK